MTWINVKDRLPEEIGNYLVYGKPNRLGYIAWSFFNSNGKWCDCNEPGSYEGVTHWMPLPDPPEDAV